MPGSARAWPIVPIEGEDAGLVIQVGGATELPVVAQGRFDERVAREEGATARSRRAELEAVEVTTARVHERGGERPRSSVDSQQAEVLSSGRR